MTSEIFPITVERLKTWTLIGHSNGDGWAGSSPMFDAFPHVGPPTYSPSGAPENVFYKNYYIFTSAIPWAGADGTPVLSDIGEGEWLEATTNNPTSPNWGHPFPSPYRYPNVRGSCYPNWMHDADTSLGGGGVHLGLELPFFWHWSHHFQEQTGLVKLALASTRFLRAERNIAGVTTTPVAAQTWFDVFNYNQLSPTTGRPETTVDSSFGFFGWWKPFDYFDWAPNTNRIYKLWLDKMEGAQAALPAGCKMDVRLVVPWFGDNDAANHTLALLTSMFKPAVLAFCKRIRQDLVENDWTTLPEHEIPIIWPAIYDGYTNGTEDTVGYCNGILDEIEADDPFFKKVSSSDWNTLVDDGYPVTFTAPALHFGPTGYVQAAEDIYEAFKDIEIEPYDALDADQRVTVEDVMGRVRTYYTRARVQTDTDDDTLLQHINGALFHILNRIGDQAWFLRRRKAVDLDAGPNTPVTLPRFVHRLLKIEKLGNVRESVEFEQINFVDGGKLQIIVPHDPAGTYTIHFITQPKELTRLLQLVPLPFQMVEWLVVETCRRLARASTNVALSDSLEKEVVALQADCMRNMGAMQRSKKDRLQKEQKLPNTKLRRGRVWGNDSSA